MRAHPPSDRRKHIGLCGVQQLQAFGQNEADLALLSTMTSKSTFRLRAVMPSLCWAPLEGQHCFLELLATREEFVACSLQHNRELAGPATGRGPLKHMAWGELGPFAYKTVLSPTIGSHTMLLPQLRFPDTEGDARLPASLFVLVRHNEEGQVN